MTDYEPFVVQTMTAKELIARTVEPRDRTIIYRGVKDSTYRLQPSALRPDGRERLRRIAEAYVKRNSHLVRDGPEISPDDTERYALMWFYDLANQQGIDLPDIPHEHRGDPLRETEGLRKQDDLTKGYEWIEIRALAQHYGIPTRMLDWTFDMNAAVYFAIDGVGPKEVWENPDKCISVWELDKSKLSLLNTEVSFVTPKYHENPNLRAQSGILSQITDVYINEPPLDELVKGAYESGGVFDKVVSDWEPVLRRLDVPYREVPEIRRNFERRGLTYHRYFPGLAGVVESMTRMSDGDPSRDVLVASGDQDPGTLAAIKEAVAAEGYNPMDAFEDGCDCPPVRGMTDRIRECRFLVIDMTQPDAGTGYVAGLAEGLGKPTILTCRKGSDDRGGQSDPETVKRSVLLWEDPDDLRSKLCDTMRVLREIRWSGRILQRRALPRSDTISHNAERSVVTVPSRRGESGTHGSGSPRMACDSRDRHEPSSSRVLDVPPPMLVGGPFRRIPRCLQHHQTTSANVDEDCYFL